MRHVALKIELTFFFVGRRGEGNHPEYTGTDPLGDCLNGSSFSCAVAPFKHDAYFKALRDNPLLEFHQFHMQTTQFFFVIFGFEGRTFYGFSNDLCHFLIRHDYRPVTDSVRRIGRSLCEV
ncbi:hypothetical protein D3C86_1595720 [compost metagenome]